MSESVTGIGAEEMTESLTGFEEIAVAKAFGRDISDLPGTQPMRALVFVWHKRTDGVTDQVAYEKAMNLSLKESMGYFDMADADPMPDEPVSESGKGDAPLG